VFRKNSKEELVKNGNYRRFNADSWDEARNELRRYQEGWVFRGQAQDEWELKTSLERESFSVPLEVAESRMLSEVQRRAHHFLSPLHVPENTIEWLALMQHHGAPTRLLDWTRSPFVAAYFAVENASRSGRCAVWCLNEKWCMDKTRELIRAVDPNLLAMFDASDPAIFDRHILPGRHALVVPVEPFRQHERLTTQQGVFTCPGDMDRSFMENLAGFGVPIDPRLVQITIPGAARAHALQELNQVNINRATLFPGIDGLAQSLKFKLVSPSPLHPAASTKGPLQ
jgi:hypothetical protein